MEEGQLERPDQARRKRRKMGRENGGVHPSRCAITEKSEAAWTLTARLGLAGTSTTMIDANRDQPRTEQNTSPDGLDAIP
jgi:hypothetical protein